MHKLIAGLGNPGTEYESTYHNVGSIFVDSLSESPWKKASRKHFVYSELDGIILIKPAVFMNKSGLAVREALSYFKIKPSSLIVAHDDSDFPWGTHKLAFGQGPAGHKGVESIIQELGTKDFWRLRIGIREEKLSRRRRAKAGEFVLKKITKKHREELSNILPDLRKEIEQIP